MTSKLCFEPEGHGDLNLATWSSGLLLLLPLPLPMFSACRKSSSVQELSRHEMGVVRSKENTDDLGK
ncbi:hypothetical protein RRG08_062378 [Elysia crispata]|uniref:Uncharacterized protein n=1 Tax=Elysia crispata TaxID=231223 RepID=A0AAE0YH24_9GAST|nr:hypothetical protein RRG08_062378 [Elysia crispata]